MGFAVSSAHNTYVQSTADQIFIGSSENSDTRVESGFSTTSIPDGSTLAFDEVGGLPSEYALKPNYPNPFNPATTIQFDLPMSTQVYLVVYDLLGREVVTLVNGQMEPGYHQIVWKGETADGREAPSGIYIARLTTRPARHEPGRRTGQARLATPGFARSIKMALLK